MLRAVSSPSRTWYGNALPPRRSVSGQRPRLIISECVVSDVARVSDYETRVSRFLDMCRGVAFLHASHVLHSDIKPDNFVVPLEYDSPLSFFLSILLFIFILLRVFFLCTLS